MSPFVGWDIQVYANNAVINATSLSISGNDFAVNATGGSAFEIEHCVNGHGTGCRSSDVPGIVHSVYQNSFTLPNNGAGANGLLFTITYQVLGTGYSPIQLLSTGVNNPNGGLDSYTVASGTYSIASYNVGAGGGGGGRGINT